MTVPKRIQLRRTKGWRMPAGAVSVARPSRWGNPITLDSLRAVYPDAADHELRRMAVSDYRGWLEGRFDPGDFDPPLDPPPSVDEIREALAGHDLCCYCPPDQACHADTLLAVANG